MSIKAGVITIDLTANAGPFFADMDKATAKLKEFGAMTASLGSAPAAGFDKMARSARDSNAALLTSVQSTNQTRASLQQLAETQHDANTALAATPAPAKEATTSLQKLGTTQPVVRSLGDSIDHVKDSSKHLALEGVSALHFFAHEALEATEAVTALVAAHLGLKAIGSTLAKEAVTLNANAFSVKSAADTAADGVRIARLALSPTIATAATVGIGIAVEELLKTVYHAGDVLERQATTAGLNKQFINPSYLANLSQAGGEKNESSYLSLYNAAGGKDLRDIADHLSSIEDPTARAREAVKLFGDDAGKALTLLNARFVENSDRVRDWGLVYSGDTRTNIVQFKNDVDSLKSTFTELDDVISDTARQAKTKLVEFLAFSYSKLRDGSLFKDLVSPFNLDQYGDLLPKPLKEGLTQTDDSASSGARGLGTVLSAAFRGVGPLGLTRIPSIGTADEQLRREMERNFHNNPKLQERLGSKDFPQEVIPDSLTDLDFINKQQSGIEGLREKLSRLRESRSKIFSEYFQSGANGQVEFKHDSDEDEGTAKKPGLSNVDKATATSSLTSVDRSIREATVQLEAAEKAKRLGESASTQAQEAQRERLRRFAEIQGEVQGSQINLAAAGHVTGQPEAKGEAEASKVIALLNSSRAALGQYIPLLTAAEEGHVRLLEKTKAQNEAETEWRNKLAATGSSILERIRLETLLTAAIGRGYEAQKQAAVEGQVIEKVGAERYNDPKWRKGHQGEVDRIRTNLGIAYDATERTSSLTKADDLNTETEATNRLAAAQRDGAEAVRLVALANKLKELSEKGATQAELDAVTAQEKATRGNEAAATLRDLHQELDATNRLTLAQLSGAEAVRQAQLESKYTQMERAGATPEVIAETKALDEANHQKDLTAEALRTGFAFKDQLESINDQIQKLELIKQGLGKNLSIEISLHELEVDRVKLMSEQALVLGTARDGMKAFFAEMAADGKSAAQEIHDSLSHTFTSLNDELAKLISGQKASWASFFKGLSGQLAKQALQGGESQVAKWLTPKSSQPGQSQPSVVLGPFGQSLPSAPPFPIPAGGQAGSGTQTAHTGFHGFLDKVFGTGKSATQSRDGQTSATALYVTLVGSDGSIAASAPGSNPGSNPLSTETPSAVPEGTPFKSLPQPEAAVPTNTGPAGTPSGDTSGPPSILRRPESTGAGALVTASDKLTRLPSGLILRESAEQPAGPDLSQLPLPDNSGLTQLNPLAELAGAGSRPGIGELPLAPPFGGADLTSEDQANLGDFSNSELNQLQFGGNAYGDSNGSDGSSSSSANGANPAGLLAALAGPVMSLVLSQNAPGRTLGSSPGHPMFVSEVNKAASGGSGGTGSTGPILGGVPGSGGTPGSNGSGSSEENTFGSIADVAGPSLEKLSTTPGLGEKTQLALKSAGLAVSILGKFFGSSGSTSSTGVDSLDLGAASDLGLTGDASSFAGPFAKGGDVKAGKRHIVGEKGMELFVPKTDGVIIPNHKLNQFHAAVNGGSPRALAHSLGHAAAFAMGKPFGGFRAEGGPAYSGYAYATGEQGPEEFWTPGARGTSVMTDKSSGPVTNISYSINAQGTDAALVDQRVRASLMAVHGSAVQKSVKSVEEHAKRTPQ